jgi:transposase
MSVRVHERSSCGLVLDQDVDTARNILNAADNPPGGDPLKVQTAVPKGDDNQAPPGAMKISEYNSEILCY